MPKKYSDTQKENIRRDLRSMAERSLFHKGVKDTSVDELVKAVGIPKGTFYLFYGSKEELYQDVMVSFRIQMQDEMLAMLQELDENHIVTSLTEIFLSLTMRFYDEGLYRFLDGAELSLVLRRLPSGSLPDLRARLEDVINRLFSYFYIDDKEDIKSFEAGYEALLYLLLSTDRLKDKEKALRLLVRGLVLQMVE